MLKKVTWLASKIFLHSVSPMSNRKFEVFTNSAFIVVLHFTVTVGSSITSMTQHISLLIRDDMYNVQDYSILYNKVVRRLHVRVGILLTTATFKDVSTKNSESTY
jgi:hypothetical protein